MSEASAGGSLESLAQALQRLAPGRVFWSGVGFLDQVSDSLNQAMGDEWGGRAVEGYLDLQAYSGSLDQAEGKALTVVLATPCPPDQLAALCTLEQAGYLGCAVMLEQRRPATVAGWSLPTPLSPLLRRNSATGSYLDELGFNEVGCLVWEAGERCENKLRSALELAPDYSPSYVVVLCTDGGAGHDVAVASYPNLSFPQTKPAAKVLTDDTVFARFAHRLAKRVHQSQLLWLGEADGAALRALEGHFRVYRSLGTRRAERPLIVMPSGLLPTLYETLRTWCFGTEVASPVLMIYGSGIPSTAAQGVGGLMDTHLLLSIPNLTVALASDEVDAENLFDEALVRQGPTALVFSSAPAVGLKVFPSQVQPRQTSVPAVVRARKLRPGQHLAIVGLGATVFPGLLAAESLLGVGWEVAVFDLRYHHPLDLNLLGELATFALVVTLEEGPKSSSFTNIFPPELGAKLLTVTVEFHELQAYQAKGTQSLTLESFGLHAEGIAQRIKEFMNLGELSGLSSSLTSRG